MSSGMSEAMERYAKECTVQIYYQHCNSPRTAQVYTEIAQSMTAKFKEKFKDIAWSCVASAADSVIGWSLFCNTWIMLQIEDILVFLFDDKP